MKLQVAIDRVSVERAVELTRAAVAGGADLIEVGTSLTKEFGVRALGPVIEAAGGVPVLGDIKTCDEGKYEFDLGFDCGFAWLTVMGSSSLGTLRACAASAVEHRGTMMIDLLECSQERIADISECCVRDFPDAVLCLHTSVDAGGATDPVAQVREFRASFPQVRRIAIAGGIKPQQLAALSAEGVDIVIMGSAITKADDVTAACRACKEGML